MGGVQQPTVFQGQALVAAAPRQPLRMAPRVAVPVQMQQHVQVRAPTISHNYRWVGNMVQRFFEDISISRTNSNGTYMY